MIKRIIYSLIGILFVTSVFAQDMKQCAVTRSQIEDFLKANSPVSTSVELTLEQENHLKAAYAFHQHPLDPTVTKVLAVEGLAEGQTYLFMFDDAGCMLTKGPLSSNLFNKAIAGEEEGPTA